MVGACAWGIPLVNGVVHVAPAVVHGAYNAGLLTGALLFLPLGIYVLRQLLRAHVLAPRRVPVVFVSGVLVHAILAAGLLAYGRGILPYAPMLAVQVANGFVPLALGTLFRSRPTTTP